MNRIMRTSCNALPSSRHRGFLLTEVLVAAMVLVAVISVLNQLMVRSGRLQMDTRHYQVALEELTNQLDRLIALDEEARSRALEELTCSPMINAVLDSPELTAVILDDANGRRLVMNLAWNRFGERKPVTLVGWLPQHSVAAKNDSAEVSSP